MRECWFVVGVYTLEQKTRSARVDGKSRPKTRSVLLILLPNVPSFLVCISLPRADTKIISGMLACSKDRAK